MQYPAYSFSQGKDTGPAPHKGAANAAAPPDAAVSCYPARSPPYFPSVTRHTSKAFWKPPKAVSKAELFAALGEAPLAPFASRERSTPLPPPTSAPQLLRGLGAEPPPAGVQGRGRPWPWRSQYHKVSPTQSLSEFTPIPLPTHKKAPFGAVA